MCILSENRKKIFVQDLETGRKASLCQAFLVCSAACPNKFYIYIHSLDPAMSKSRLQFNIFEKQNCKRVWVNNERKCFLLLYIIHFVICLSNGNSM